MKQLLPYGVAGGALIALLKVIEYKHFIEAYPSELYGGLLAVLFTAVGIWAALKWMQPKEVVVVQVREVPVPDAGPFVPDEESRKGLGITPREHEILALIAQGLSNREIGEKLFVSENTVKTHSSRLFDKMSVNRRMQAVQRGRELRLIP